MTTRRDVLTGIAAAPLAAATGSEAEASAAPQAAPAPASRVTAPAFLHEIDRDVFREVEVLEHLVARMKAHILVANHANPMIRYGALFDMRCGLGSAGLSMGWLRSIVEDQRLGAHEARLAEEIRLDAEGRPHSPEFLARCRKPEGEA